MANKEFSNIEEFIEGFTRTGPTPEKYIYDGVIWGMEFKFHNHIFRITRDPIGNEIELRKKFNKTEKAHIKLFEIPENEYPNAHGNDLDKYLGIFDDVYDLLNNGKIDEVPLKDIIASNQTEILAID